MKRPATPRTAKPDTVTRDPPNPYAPSGRTPRIAPFFVRLRNALRYAGDEYRRNIRRQKISRMQQASSWAGLMSLLFLLLLVVVFLIAVAWSALSNILEP